MGVNFWQNMCLGFSIWGKMIWKSEKAEMDCELKCQFFFDIFGGKCWAFRLSILRIYIYIYMYLLVKLKEKKQTDLPFPWKIMTPTLFILIGALHKLCFLINWYWYLFSIFQLFLEKQLLHQYHTNDWIFLIGHVKWIWSCKHFLSIDNCNESWLVDLRFSKSSYSISRLIGDLNQPGCHC